MRYLIQNTEVYRVETENEATRMIEEAKQDGTFTLDKYTCKHKENKKTEEEWYQLTLVKKFNDEKEPDYEVEVSYNTESKYEVE